MRRRILFPISDDNDTDQSLFGCVRNDVEMGWWVDDADWRNKQAWLSERLQTGNYVEAQSLFTSIADGKITLGDLTMSFRRAMEYDDVREAKDNADETSCELTFTSPQQMVDAYPLRGFPNAPSFSDPTMMGDAQQYPFDLGCPVFVVKQGWATPFPVFSEFQYLVGGNELCKEDDYSWLGGRVKALRYDGADINATDIPMLLIPLPDHEPYLVGKVAMLNTNRFSVVDNIADPIRTGQHAGKPLIRPDISFDVFKWLRATYQPAHPQNTGWTNICIKALENTLNDITFTANLNDHIDEYGYLESSIMLLKHLSAVNMLAGGNSETPIVNERAGDFIPSWKDKRKVIIIDRASPRYPVFHDEIRCAGCNGRVLMKLPAGNTLSSLPCPHELCESTLQFTHLLGNQNAEKGGTENENERD